MSRPWAERRHHRERVVAKRLRLVRAVVRHPDDYYLARTPGRAAKTKVLDCSCWTCKGHAKFRWRRGKERHRVKAALAGWLP